VTPPNLHSTPDDAVADRIRETVFVEKKTFFIERPAGLDKVFDHPAVRAAYAKDEYIPYWADLWASARMLAKVVLREPWLKLSQRFGTPLDVLEVGCGLGLAGIAGLARGLRVTFSDCDEAAVKFAASNAALNGFRDYKLLPIDFRSPPTNLAFPVVIGSDLMYEERLVKPLVDFIDRTLLDGGVAFIADPDRMAAKSFRWRLQNAGLNVEVSPQRAGEPGGERTKGTLYRISKQAP
jgi:predicted nicotinamide N-methyase